MCYLYDNQCNNFVILLYLTAYLTVLYCYLSYYYYICNAVITYTLAVRS